jgi:hypothetical protein
MTERPPGCSRVRPCRRLTHAARLQDPDLIAPPPRDTCLPHGGGDLERTQLVIEAWPRSPADTKTKIVGFVQGSYFVLPGHIGVRWIKATDHEFTTEIDTGAGGTEPAV